MHARMQITTILSSNMRRNKVNRTEINIEISLWRMAVVSPTKLYRVCQ